MLRGSMGQTIWRGKIVGQRVRMEPLVTRVQLFLIKR